MTERQRNLKLSLSGWARAPWGGRKRLVVLAALSLLLMISASAWAYYLTTHRAISQVLSAGVPAVAAAVQPHYLFSINGVAEPYGVAVTSSGDRIYVVEGGGERLIRAFDREGKALFAFAPPDTPVGGRRPVYVTVDETGLVYVVDRMRAAIDVYDAGGNYKTSIRSPLETGWLPLGVRAVGDHLLVTEVTKGKNRVLKLSKDGKLLSEFGREGQEKGELAYPNSVAEDARGRIIVSDGNNARVQVFDPSGAVLQVIYADFSLPRGIAVDGYQRLYVVDTIGQQVTVFDARGDDVRQLFAFGDLGAGDGQFSYPNDIAIDDSDRLYISDRANNRVQVWAY